jgi:hypothetical protein
VWYSFREYLGDDLEVGYESVPAMTGGTAFGRLARGELVLEGMPVIVASRQASSGNFAAHSASGGSLSGLCEVMLLADDRDDSHIEGEITCLLLYKGEHVLRVSPKRPLHRRRDSGNDAADFYDLYHEDDFDAMQRFDDFHCCTEHVFGIALVPVPGEDEVYRRIGLFHAEGAGCLGEFGKRDPPVLQVEEMPPPSGFEQELRQCIQVRDTITLI